MQTVRSRLRRLLSTQGALDAPAGPLLLSQSVTLMWLLGSALLLLSLVVPHPASVNEPAVAVIVAAACVISAGFAVAFDTIPLRLFEASVYLGLPLVGSLVYFSGDASSSYALYYVWIVVHSSY